MKPGSSTSASSRSRGTTPSTPTGSWTDASHASGSTHLNTSRVWASQDQRRFIASSSSAASSGGRDGRTVKLRRAFIPPDATQPPEPRFPGAPDRQRSVHASGATFRGPWHTRSGASSPERSSSPSPSRRSSSPIPGPGEALVQVQACGVCHTDLHYREGGINDDFPFLLGHEAAGVVEAVGPDVVDVAPGDFVILNWRAVCGECRACRRGRPWYCFSTHNATQKMTLDGVELSPALGIGAFAEKTLVAAGQCTKVSSAVKPEVAGLLGCGVMAGLGAAMLTGEVGRGDSVAVFGCGGVGDAAIAGARLAGAHTIIAVDLDPRKLELAKEFGATHTVDASSTDPVEAIQALTDGNGADVCIEAVGNPKVFEQAFYARDLAGTRRAGRRAEPRDADRPPDDRLLRPGRAAQAELVRRLPAEPRLPDARSTSTSRAASPLEQFVSETIGLDEVEEAFHKMERGEVLRSVVVL